MGRAAVIVVGLVAAGLYANAQHVDEMWYWAAVLPATYLVGMALLFE